jgi:hypothetical protein
MFQRLPKKTPTYSPDIGRFLAQAIETMMKKQG